MVQSPTDVQLVPKLHNQSQSGINEILRASCKRAMRHLVHLSLQILQCYVTGRMPAKIIRTVAGALVANAKFCFGVCEPRALSFEARSSSFEASSSSSLEARLVPDPTKLELESDNPREKVEDNRERLWTSAEKDEVERIFRGLLEYFIRTAQTMSGFMKSIPIEEVDWYSFMQVCVETARTFESCLSSQTETVATAAALVTPAASFDQDHSSGAEMLPDQGNSFMPAALHGDVGRNISPIPHRHKDGSSPLSFSMAQVGTWIGTADFREGYAEYLDSGSNIREMGSRVVQPLGVPNAIGIRL